MAKSNPLLDILLDAYRKGQTEEVELKEFVKDIEQNLKVLVESAGK